MLEAVLKRSESYTSDEDQGVDYNEVAEVKAHVDALMKLGEHTYSTLNSEST